MARPTSVDALHVVDAGRRSESPAAPDADRVGGRVLPHPAADGEQAFRGETRARRILNVVVALLGIVVTLPLSALIALALKLTTGGPVLYVQERVGLDRRRGRGDGSAMANDRRRRDLGGRSFRMWKFRTMCLDAEARTGAVWCSQGDPRVTRFGRFLRHARLDELPQLVNVLKGDMNVVGPRPERPDIFAGLRAAIPDYASRQRCRPGITGYAQVTLEYDASVRDVAAKLQYDLRYLARQSIAADLRIMARTVPVMLFRRRLLRRAEEPSTSPDARPSRPPVVVHVTSVPLQLRIFLEGQVRYLTRQGFALHAVSSAGPDLDRFGTQEGIPVHAVNVTQRVSPLEDAASLARLWRTLREVHPDVVHAHSPKGGLLGMLAALLARVPVRIYHIRGLPHTTSSGVRRLVLVASERVSCGLAHRVLAVSRSIRDIAVAEGLCREDKIEVLARGSGNGVDAVRRFVPAPDPQRAAERAALGIPPGSLVVGFVGRLVREKGLCELVAVWKGLREEVPQAHLLVVGGEESKAPLPAGVLDVLRLDPRVHLTGDLPSADHTYAAMDVVVLPSHREGLPNVALEAAAVGLPIVATRVAGCVDAIDDGVTGTLVPAGDVGALRDALVRYIQDSELRRRHGAAARRHVAEQFRQEAIWDAVVSRYRTLLREREPRGRAHSPPWLARVLRRSRP